MNQICIAGRIIGGNEPPYIVAEMSGNHNSSLDNALNIVLEAKKAGADAIKLQTYRPDTITLDCNKKDFFIDQGLWSGQRLYDLYKTAHTPWEWHKPIFEYAKKLQITIFSTPFDTTAVDFLEDLDCPAYKIASFEAIDLELVKYVASTKKPLIISTGMCNKYEIQDVVETALTSGCNQLALLHCVSGYPALASEYNLRTIPDMANRYKTVVGLSDHTLGIATSIASVAMGASLIEKHFTLNRNGGGVDDSFSIEPLELNALCNSARIAWEAMGVINYEKKLSEEANIRFRRSLYFVKALKAGDLITSDSVRSIRPGFGLPPKYLSEIIGSMVTDNVEIGTAITWELIKRK